LRNKLTGEIISEMSMADHKVVSREEWGPLRASLLEKEKQLTRARDSLAAEVRSLPWIKLESPYVFHTTDGDKTLAELFDGKSQLVVYHLMFGSGWKAACPSCTFWADNFTGLKHHLPQRDVSFKAISRAPLEDLLAYKKRMGWEFDWVSAADTAFNFDLGHSNPNPPEIKDPERPHVQDIERPGISIFSRDGDDVYQTYYTTARGLEVLNPVYGILDLVPKGRDEAGVKPYAMAWVKRHDEY
jgi:predicted dithiol-disulfide oxidoreductase (DUF899 family)